MRRITIILSFLWCVYGCWQGPQQVTEVNRLPELFPDFQGVTIPVNIAPLNFKVVGSDKVDVEFRKGRKTLLKCHGLGKIDIPQKKWHALLEDCKGDSLEVKVFACKDGQWMGYRPFPLWVAADSIDPYVAYRLIEPGYELGRRLGLFQRELSSFEERAFVAPQLSPNSCVNCHAFCNYSPDHFMYHVRWEHSGTVIVEPGNIRKVNTKTDSVISPGAYRMWHPSGKYIAFSNNLTHQAFHAFTEKKIEVYDLASGLMIYDVRNNKVLTDKRFCTKSEWKTFPAWSPDGKYLYYCEAEPKTLPQEYKELRYGLCRVAFDEESGCFGESLEKIALPGDSLKSVVFPVVSPDGRYILYTTAASGTFPIWHQDADLALFDLESGEVVDISVVNSDCADSYHAWSSNGRWIVFSSRRGDRLYTRLYLAYFDRNGQMHKPFILPQKDPDEYTYHLKSFNIPEFIQGPVTVSPYQLQETMQGEAENAM